MFSSPSDSRKDHENSTIRCCEARLLRRRHPNRGCVDVAEGQDAAIAPHLRLRHVVATVPSPSAALLAFDSAPLDTWQRRPGSLWVVR